MIHYHLRNSISFIMTLALPMASLKIWCSIPNVASSGTTLPYYQLAFDNKAGYSTPLFWNEREFSSPS